MADARKREVICGVARPAGESLSCACSVSLAAGLSGVGSDGDDDRSIGSLAAVVACATFLLLGIGVSKCVPCHKVSSDSGNTAILTDSALCSRTGSFWSSSKGPSLSYSSSSDCKWAVVRGGREGEPPLSSKLVVISSLGPRPRALNCEARPYGEADVPDARTCEKGGAAFLVVDGWAAELEGCTNRRDGAGVCVRLATIAHRYALLEAEYLCRARHCTPTVLWKRPRGAVYKLAECATLWRSCFWGTC